jgi:hypothetical protein
MLVHKLLLCVHKMLLQVNKMLLDVHNLLLLYVIQESLFLSQLASNLNQYKLRG